MNERTAKAWSLIIASLAAAIIGIIGAMAGFGDDDVVQVDPRPTPAEAQLPTTAAGELVGKADTPASAEQPLRSTDVPGETKAEERDTIQENAATVEDQAVEYDTSRVLEGAAGEPAHFACYTSMNGGIRPTSAIGLHVVHVTVSLNVAGLADVNGLCDFFRRVQASPTWTVDNEGNSAENVPLGRTPWTQVIFNRPSCATEFVGSTGRPGEGPAQWTDVQLREGARLAARCMAIAGIPVRKAIVRQDGTIVRTGVITHQELGAAGGGHSDPGPYFNMDRYLELIRGFLHPCGDRCKARKRQKKIIAARVHRHEATHADYQREHCRGRLHEVKARQLRRPECRAIKERGHRQRAGIRRARRTLHAI